MNIYRQLHYPPDFSFDFDDENEAEMIEVKFERITLLFLLPPALSFATDTRICVECLTIFLELHSAKLSNGLQSY